MLDFFREISGPVTMHLELTEACTERCRHCYNFVRDPEYRPRTITESNIDFYLDDFKANGGFHVILTGGEPLAAFNKLIYAVRGCRRRGLSISLNSNLMLSEPEKMRTLKEEGIDHILTTLFSHNPETHDFIASREGAYKEILKGINIARDAGIRVSVNMIVTNVNDKDVYETGKLLHNMGMEKFIANRMIPSTLNSKSLKDEFLIKDLAARRMLDDLLRLNNDFGMTVSTCRALPHCFFGDIEEYSPFTSRGCNGGKRHLLVGVAGNARACVHEAEEYGNVHEIGIKGIWANMEKWRRKDLLPEKCQECALVNICEGGCRQVADVAYGDWSEKDNLCREGDGDKTFHRGVTGDLLDEVKNGSYVINPDIDLRREDGCYLVRIFGAKCVLIEDRFGDFLDARKNNNVPFTLSEFPEKDAGELGLYLVNDMLRSNKSAKKFATIMEHYKR